LGSTFNALCLVSLCEATRLDAQVYLSQVLPLAVTVVNNISMYFENYSGLTYVSWKANLGSIVREVNDYQVECVSQNYKHFTKYLIFLTIFFKNNFSTRFFDKM
jgi:hypothetical protein